MNQSFSHLLIKGKRFLALLYWIVNRSFINQKRKVLLTSTLGIISPALQGAAFFCIYWYAKNIQENKLITYPLTNNSVYAREDLFLLLAVSAIAVIALFFSAALLYASRHMMMRIAERAFKTSLIQIITSSEKLPDIRAPLASRLSMKPGALISGARRTAVTAQNIGNSFPNLIGSLTALMALFWIEWKLTLIMIVISAISITAIYPVAIHAIAYARRLKIASSAYNEYRTKVFRKTQALSDETVNNLSKEYAFTLSARRHTIERIKLRTNMGLTTAISVAVFYIAYSLITSGGDWAIFVAYIGALQITLSRGLPVIATLAGVSRFYPDILHYFQFEQEIAKMDTVTTATLDIGDHAIISNTRDNNKVMLNFGSRTAVITTESAINVMLALNETQHSNNQLPVRSKLLHSYTEATEIGSDCSLICIPAQEISVLDEAQRERFFNLMKARCLLIIYTHINEPIIFAEHKLLSLSNAKFSAADAGTAGWDELINNFRSSTQNHHKGKHYNNENDDEDDDI